MLRARLGSIAMYLFRLTYYSRNKIAEGNASLTDSLKSILQSCKKNNPGSGISGALMFSNDYFAQVLEGDRKSVTETFCRISQDPRHGDIVILHAHPIEQRLFGDWAMSFAGQSEASEVLYNRYSTYASFNPAKMSGASLEALVVELANTEHQVARTKL